MLTWVSTNPKKVFALLGAFLALGQAPLSLWALAFAALISAQYIWLVAPDTRRFWTVWWFGFGYFLISMNWLVEPFLVDIKRHGFMAPFAVGAMASGLALIWAFPVWIIRASPFLLAFAVGLGEFARGFLFTGFPWGQIAYVWVDTPIALWAAFIGSYGLSTVTVLMALAIAWVLRAPRRLIFAPLLAVILFGPSLIYRPIVETSDQIIRVIQPNAIQSQKWDPEHSMTFFQRSLDYTGRSGDVDLIVWPESSVPVFLNYADDLMQDIVTFAQGRPVLVGALRFEDYDYYNSVVMVDEDGSYEPVYDKQHLVPFGEYLPFNAFFQSLGLSALADMVGGGFTPGETKDFAQVPNIGAVKPLICYEAVFPQDVQSHGERPNMLVQMTNDAWFGNFSGPYQHLAQTQMRAIEQGLPLVRAANTGVSAVIDPLGEIIQIILLNQQGYMDVALPKPIEATVYSQFGDRFVIILLSILGVLCFIKPQGVLGLTQRTQSPKRR